MRLSPRILMVQKHLRRPYYLCTVQMRISVHLTPISHYGTRLVGSLSDLEAGRVSQGNRRAVAGLRRKSDEVEILSLSRLFNFFHQV